MRLQEVLNKFNDTGFVITVKGLCDEMPFCEYEREKKEDYWKKYKDKKVLKMSILMTDGVPELCINIED